MILRYYLVQEASAEAEDTPVYGIGIIKSQEGQETEREWLPGLSHRRETAERILQKLMDGTVTPVGAVAVVDDLMGV